MTGLPEYLTGNTAGDLIPWSVQQEAAARFHLTPAEVEEQILLAGLLPARYQRNRRTISTAGQLRLFRSRVTVIGCGGLGGYIIEELSRLGVGTIIAVDPDIFEEHNLNRQLFSTPATLGYPKVQAAAERVGLINPAVTLIPQQVAFGEATGDELMRDATVVVDALDSIPVRLELAKVCTRQAIPLVHGAIGGWFGHVAVQLPGDESIETIYGSWKEGKGIEQSVGNPSFTPAVVASLQVAEAVKIILGEGRPLRQRQLVVDLLEMEFHEIEL